MVSGRVSRFTRIPDTPDMLSTSEDDPEWGLHFLMSFPSTIRDNAQVYHAAWLKKGFGPKVMLAVLKEDDLTHMKFLDAHARMIIQYSRRYKTGGRLGGVKRQGLASLGFC